MRAGFNVYDADTHVNPAAEVLDRYVDPGFRPRLAELAPYRVAMKSHGGTAQTHQYRVATKFFLERTGGLTETVSGHVLLRLPEEEAIRLGAAAPAARLGRAVDDLAAGHQPVARRKPGAQHEPGGRGKPGGGRPGPPVRR